MKEDVEDLPEKEEVVIWVELTQEQKRWEGLGQLACWVRWTAGFLCHGGAASNWCELLMSLVHASTQYTMSILDQWNTEPNNLSRTRPGPV